MTNPRWRSHGASVILLVLSCVVLLVGTATLYARSHIFDADRLAGQATSTLDDSDVRDVAAKRLATEVEKAEPDLITAGPLIEAAASALIDTSAFKAAFDRGVKNAYGAVFEGKKDDAAVVIANVGVLLREALQRFQPELAKKLPKGLDADLVDLQESDAAVDAAQAAERIRRLGVVLPLLGLLLLAGSIAVAPRRRHAVTRAGVAIGVIGLAMVVLMFAGRALVEGAIEDQAESRAAGAVWDAFLGTLQTWFLVLGGAGLVVASAAASLLRPVDLDEPLRRGWRRISSEPQTPGARLVWGMGLAAAGLVMVLAPGLVLRLAIVVAGAYILSRALSAAIAVVSGPPQEAGGQPLTGMRLGQILLRAGIALGAVVLAVVVVLAVTGGEDEDGVSASEVTTCNGSAELCSRPLDKVSMPATHNSYAGSAYAGFLFPEQEGTIDSQLAGGVRGLWIDTYYGLPGDRVYTDTSKIDPALNAQLKQELGPKFEQAAAKIRGQISKPQDVSPRIYLCHGYCELGAVDAEQAFEGIATFLEDNPGEVLVIDLEDYTEPDETAALIEKTGLGDHVYKGPAGPPWPTLRQMIDDDARVLIGAEHRTEGAPSWYRKAYSMFQETPFQFKTPSEMNCKPNRGSKDNSLFLINNWIDTDPTPKPSNAKKVNAYDFLLDRARRCQRQRGLLPNALNVDFWQQGDVFGVANTLNGLPRKGSR
jgi:hypothetical protein